MIEKYVKAGQKVDICAVKRTTVRDDGERVRTYSTKVYDIVSEDQIELFMPIEQSRLILLPVDGEYEIFFYR